MCGLAGFIGLPNQGLLDLMSQSMQHRGPDDFGSYVDQDINFAFRRMSVIDLNHGNQPIQSENKKFIGMVNGEIYNFQELRKELSSLGIKFNSNSDSEVVIQGFQIWGTSLFKKLKGMFAIALWDSENKELILARDPIGKKPLHYFIGEDKAMFASEIKTIASTTSIKLIVDPESVIEYFSLESIGNEKTIYKNLFKVQAGHYVVIDKNFQVKSVKYWKPNLDLIDLPLEDFLTEIDLKIRNAVEKRLIADVPIGLFLSGGVDSATVMAHVAGFNRKDIKIFTASFDDKSYDESLEAKKIANYFDFETFPIQISNSEAIRSFDAVIDCLDEPLSDPAIIPQLGLSKAAKNYVDVVLTGDGGDELFLGYPNFQAHQLMAKLSYLNKFSSFLNFVLKNIKSKGNYFDFGFKAQRFSRGLGESDFWLRDFQWRGAFTSGSLSNLIKNSSESRVHDLLIKRIKEEISNFGNFQSTSQEITYGYLSTYLRDNVLVKVDRATMRYGLEARSPFLDIDLFEFVNRIPDNFRMSKMGSKKILKSVLKKHLPSDLIAKQKHGLGVPVGKWLNNDLKGQLLDFLNPTFLNNQGIFEPKIINQMQLDHQNGRYDYRKELWSFLVFQRWYSKWMG